MPDPRSCSSDGARWRTRHATSWSTSRPGCGRTGCGASCRATRRRRPFWEHIHTGEVRRRELSDLDLSISSARLRRRSSASSFCSSRVTGGLRPESTASRFIHFRIHRSALRPGHGSRSEPALHLAEFDRDAHMIRCEADGRFGHQEQHRLVVTRRPLARVRAQGIVDPDHSTPCRVSR